jgi:TRAP-type C4-dicarboxylate transport system substrate-binding protein
MNPGISGCATVMSTAAYNKLPPQYQKLLEEVKGPAYQAMIDAYAKADAENLPIFRKRLTEIIYTPEQLKEFEKKAGRPVWDKWVEDNKSKFDAKSVLDTMLAETEKALAKHVKK